MSDTPEATDPDATSAEAETTTAPTAPQSEPAVIADRAEVSSGLAFLHGVVGTTLLSAAEANAHLYALTELLIGKGLITLHELERRKAVATQTMVQETVDQWPGAKVHPDEIDKYTVEPVDIDCLDRLHLCKASCCRLSFNLSRQDVAEGVVQWDFARPYHIKQREDGHCAHCAEGSFGCTVRQNRPLVCRQYDCRGDERIWVDFEKRIPHPDIAKL